VATAKTKQDSTALSPQHRHDVSVNERFSNDKLRDTKTLDQALELLAEAYGGVASIGDFELGSGFKLLSDGEEQRLIGVPFLIIHFQFNEGDFGEFASITLMTADKNQDRLILNDGSTGICQQLRDIAETGRYGGIMVPRGLRKSEYDTCTNCGKPRKPSQNPCPNSMCNDTSEKRAKGATFYLDVSE